jgi:hypothetical protein
MHINPLTQPQGLSNRSYGTRSSGRRLTPSRSPHRRRRMSTASPADNTERRGVSGGERLGRLELLIAVVAEHPISERSVGAERHDHAAPSRTSSNAVSRVCLSKYLAIGPPLPPMDTPTREKLVALFVAVSPRERRRHLGCPPRLPDPDAGSLGCTDRQGSEPPERRDRRVATRKRRGAIENAAAAIGGRQPIPRLRRAHRDESSAQAADPSVRLQHPLRVTNMCPNRNHR